MKVLFLVYLLLATTPTWSHIGHHGPKVDDPGKYGGVVFPVILNADAQKEHPKMVYKAELVRIKKRVRVFLYDAKMNALALDDVSKEANGIIENTTGRLKKSKEFKLKLKKKAFIGKVPKLKVKPFNIEIVFQKGGKEYFVSFGNLD